VTTPAPNRARTNLIAAVTSLLLAVPFIIFGVFMVNTQARVELQCKPGGPCTVTRSGYLTAEAPAVYQLEDMRGVKVERNRKSRLSDEFVWRPVLETEGGDVPLSYGWMTDQRKAVYAATVLERYFSTPIQSFTLWHDDRAGPARLGTAFIVVGLVMVGASIALALRARRFRRAEQAPVAG
jgi:hypothetical protein